MRVSGSTPSCTIKLLRTQERTIEEPWIDELNAIFKDYKGKVLAADAWLILNLPPGQRDQVHNDRFGNAMKATGWTRKKAMYFKGHGTGNGYWRDAAIEIDDEEKIRSLKRIFVERKNGQIEISFECDDPQQPPM